MENLPELIKELLNTASEKDKYFLVRRPSLRQIEKEIKNFDDYFEEGKLEGKKIPMANNYYFDGKVIGYNSFVILQDAKPTKYEEEFIDMGEGLDYFYFKKLFVHPNFRRKGIGSKLFESSLEIAEKLEKHSIIDIEKNNYKMVNILQKNNFQEDYEWVSRKGIKMTRFFHHHS